MTFNSTDRSHAETTTWLTPLKLVRSLGAFDLDPCGYPGHHTAERLICLPNDGLAQEWTGRVWLNPPYGKEAAAWIKKLSEHGNGIALIFCRLETKWLKPYLSGGFFVLDGRIAFHNPEKKNTSTAGAASILLPFGRKNIGAILSSDLCGEWYQ